MKQLVLLLLAFSTSIVLAGCQTKSANQRTGITPSHRPVASDKNRGIARDLEAAFNQHGQVVKATVNPAVVDEHSATTDQGTRQPHQTISVMATDRTLIKTLKACQQAVEDHSASQEQQLYLAGIQETIEIAAKRLVGQDTVQFGYPLDGNNTALIANAQRDHNIIKPIEVIPADLE